MWAVLVLLHREWIFVKNILIGNESLGNSALSIDYLAPYTFTLANNIIADNISSESGGLEDTSVRIRGSNGQMLHNTLAGNQGIKGGVSVTRNSNVELTNNIIVSHTVGISVTADSSALLEATLWGSGVWANDEDWGGDGIVYTGTVNLWSLPGFVDPYQDDYHISLDSTAVDVGVSSKITDDIDDDVRPSGGGFDIGADEVPVQWDWVLYLPQLMK